MDFIIYYNDILIPFLQMITDMCRCNSISYQDALRIGGNMCDIGECFYVNKDINYDMLEQALYDFEINLKQFNER